jgi:hypothetical protein
LRIAPGTSPWGRTGREGNGASRPRAKLVELMPAEEDGDVGRLAYIGVGACCCWNAKRELAVELEGTIGSGSEGGGVVGGRDCRRGEGVRYAPDGMTIAEVSAGAGKEEKQALEILIF